MSKIVRVKATAERSGQDTATLLLAAAEESSDHTADAVQVSSYGGFLVPEEIAKSAGLDFEEEGVAMGHVFSEDEVVEAEKTEVETPEPLENSPEAKDPEPEAKAEPKTTAKKAPAKKTAAKKTTAKKTASKKTGA